MNKVKLVIFDCDGVLMDSEIVSARVESDIYRQHGLEIDSQELAARFAGSSSIDILKELEQESELPISASIVDEIEVAVEEQCGDHAQMISDADEVVNRLEQPCCICSNSPQSRLQRMLSRVGLFDKFSPYIFSAKDFDPPADKPKPDMLLKALEQFEISSANAILIEDSVFGVEAGIAADIRVVGFTGASHTYSGHADRLMEAGAETVIRKLKDLPAIIEVFEKWKHTTD